MGDIYSEEYASYEEGKRLALENELEHLKKRIKYIKEELNS